MFAIFHKEKGKHVVSGFKTENLSGLTYADTTDAFIWGTRIDAEQAISRLSWWMPGDTFTIECDSVARYRFRMCRHDGTTPLDVELYCELVAEDWRDAHVKFHNANPDFEVVSWGLASELDEWNRKNLRRA